MHINQDNYEQYFLDHAEGNLSPEMERELTDFLEANPDLKPVLADFDPAPIQTVEIHNDLLKSRLRKSLRPTEHIREDTVDEWLIREAEGLLDESEENELKAFLSLNPAYSFDQKIFGHVKFTADLSISFPKKDELKKKGLLLPGSRLTWLLPAAAAVIMLFIGIRFLWQPGNNPLPPANIAVVDKPEFRPALVEEVAVSPPTGTPALGTPAPEQVAEMTRVLSFRLEPVENQTVIHHNPASTIKANLAVFDIDPGLIMQKKEKPLIAKVINNMLAKARDGFNDKTNPDQFNMPDFSFWTLAKAGIDGYNSISDRDIELLVRKDDDGKAKSYALIDQDRLIWSKELNRE